MWKRGLNMLVKKSEEKWDTEGSIKGVPSE